MILNRRKVLIGMSGLSLVACVTGPSPLITPRKTVQVNRARIQRSLVGLRPARKGGFRLDHENVGDTHIFHNYGHGGDGVTLSWPCAHWVADEVSKLGRKSIAIIGAGVSGLSTAFLLSGRGHQVTVYADKFSPQTTSNVAGAMILKSERYRRGPQAHGVPTDAEINDQIESGFEPHLQTRGSGAYKVDYYQMASERAPKETDLGLFLGRAVIDQYPAIMVDPMIYLPYLMEAIRGRGGNFVTQRFTSRGALQTLDEPIIINCAGLGAGEIFSDPDVYPIRGQLTLLEPQSGIDYGYVARDPGGILYMFPRETSIVLGGSYERRNASLEIDPEETIRQLHAHAKLMQFAKDGVQAYGT